MKLLVLSDSHRNTSYMLQAIEAEKPDYVIHLGDHTKDADAIRVSAPYLPLISIRGNCDFDPAVPEKTLQEWDGVRILMTHGHIYNVKSGMLRLSLAAREAQADVVLFGHTHITHCAKEGTCWFLNPGSCRGAYSTPTYGLVEITDGNAVCSVKSID